MAPFAHRSAGGFLCHIMRCALDPAHSGRCALDLAHPGRRALDVAQPRTAPNPPPPRPTPWTRFNRVLTDVSFALRPVLQWAG